MGKEDPETYNARVQEALEELAFNKESFIVMDHGRTEEEVSVVWVERGKYLGFGYVDQSEIMDIEDLKSAVKARKHNRDVTSILKSFLKRKKVKKIIHLEDSLES